MGNEIDTVKGLGCLLWKMQQSSQSKHQDSTLANEVRREHGPVRCLQTDKDFL